MPEHATDTPRTHRGGREGPRHHRQRRQEARGTGDPSERARRRCPVRNPWRRHATARRRQALIVARLENEVGFLRELVRSRDEELRREREAREGAERRHDTIVMRMAERIPELEAPPTPGPRDAPETDGDGAGGVGHPATEGAQDGAERRSGWWRRFFGF